MSTITPYKGFRIIVSTAGTGETLTPEPITPYKGFRIIVRQREQLQEAARYYNSL